MTQFRRIFSVSVTCCVAVGAFGVRADYDYENGNQCRAMSDLADESSEHRIAYMAAPADRPHGGIQAGNYFAVICSIPRKRVYDSGNTNLQVSVYAYGRGGATMQCGIDVVDHRGRSLLPAVEASTDFGGDLNKYEERTITLPSLSFSGVPWYATYTLRCETTGDLPAQHRVFGYYWRTF